MAIDRCRAGHTKLRVKRASKRNRVIAVLCALKDIIVGCSVSSFVRSDNVLLRDRHDIVAEQNVFADRIKAEFLCGRRVSEFETKDTIVACRTISLYVLEL